MGRVLSHIFIFPRGIGVAPSTPHWTPFNGRYTRTWREILSTRHTLYFDNKLLLFMTEYA